MVQHTPGPWKAQPGTTTGQEVISPSASAVRRVIARCGGPARDGNARLIAAAPQMYAVLQLVRMSKGWQYLSLETRDLLDDVIADAEGK